jgi:transposase
MIPAGVQVFVALEPVDLRYGFERLSGWVRERVGYEARSGALFVFLGRRRATLKIIFFDGSGNCVFSKRLDHGTFPLPVTLEPGAKQVAIGAEELHLLLGGVPGRVKRRAVRGPPLH